jgi:hypothetical protein
MGIHVKNGTPLNGPSLCDTCSLAFIARGYGETELVVVCQATDSDVRIRFRVRECTEYNDKTKPAYWQMEKIALVLDRVALKRDAGFVRIKETENSGEKIELILDENSQ